jgi:hypothetical protein
MAKKSRAHSTVQAVTGLVKAVPVYKDAVQPAAKELGKSLATLAKAINVAIAPIAAMVWGYEQIQTYLSGALAKRLSHIPLEEIITPSPIVAGPVLESLRFAGSVEELREMYANLLAASMNRKTASDVHPSFVDIIKHLTPDEARIMKLFARRLRYPVVDILARNETDNKTFTYQAKTVAHNHSLLGKVAKCEIEDNTAVYLDNLCRLGLLEIDEGKLSEHDYDGIVDEAELEGIRKEVETDGFKVEIRKKLVQITNLGLRFLAICLPGK